MSNTVTISIENIADLAERALDNINAEVERKKKAVLDKHNAEKARYDAKSAFGQFFDYDPNDHPSKDYRFITSTGKMGFGWDWDKAEGYNEELRNKCKGILIAKNKGAKEVTLQLDTLRLIHNWGDQ